MKGIIKYFLDRSLLVNIASLGILITGILSIYLLRKEMFPNVDFDTIIISTIYPGSSAEDVEKLITIPIERQLKSVNGIKETSSISREGQSLFYLKIEPNYQLDDVLIDARNAVETTEDLPSAAETPVINKLDTKQKPIIKIALFGKNENEIRLWSKSLRDYLESKIPGIARIDFLGYRDEVIEVAVDPKKLRRNELTIGQITDAIASRNVNLSGGKIKGLDYNVTIQTQTEFIEPQEIADVIVRGNDTGRSLKVSDLANITNKYDEDATLHRAQGKRAIILDVIKKEKADVINTTDALKEYTSQFFTKRKLQEKEISYTFLDDTSFYVKRRLNVLTKNGMQGMFLVFVCLLIFMNVRISLVTSIGAPLSFLVAFALMDSMGITINLISMFGLIMVLGMLVDDSIIVSEQFYQNLESGLSPKDAAFKSALETIKPVTATILTTIAAFASLFFMGGIMGKFLWPVPTVIIICLAASWLECFFIHPVHLREWVKLSHSKWRESWYPYLVKAYEKTLSFFLKIPLITILFFFALLASSIVVNQKFMRFILFPSDGVYIFTLNYKGEVGTALEKTERIMSQLETIVLEEINDQELESTRTVVGEQARAQQARSGNHYGGMFIYLTPEVERERKTQVIIDAVNQKIRENLPQERIIIEKIETGPPKGKPVDIELLGNDLEVLKTLAQKIERELKKQEGITTTDIEYEEIKKQILLKIDQKEATRLGLNTLSIAQEVRRAYQGDSITEIRKSDEDVEIRVRYNLAARSDEKSLLEVPINNISGRPILLKRVTQLSESPAPYFIHRLNEKKSISVEGEINTKKITSNEINKKMVPIVDNFLKDFPEVSYRLAGENEDTKESVQRLQKSGIISLFVIFIILVAMFNSVVQPIVVMSAIPLALIGVIYTFFIMGVPFSFMALLGMIGLVGVVVNDSIVLVSFINTKLESSKNSFQAVLEASRSRFRPVILTTVTTVAGLLPIAHDPLGDPFLKPMALSFAYGLIFSSLLTLIFVPCAYLLYRKIIPVKSI